MLKFKRANIQYLFGYFYNSCPFNQFTVVEFVIFANYKEKRDALESQYLQREISYVDYVEGMDELDESYAKEVQERDAKILSK